MDKEKEYLKDMKEDIEEFKRITKQFYNKEISVAEYKHASGGFGSYAQRGGEKSMLRLRLCGGEINMQNLKFIVEAIDKYHVDLAHFTTCQNVQLHDLSLDMLFGLIDEAFEAGIITRGGGGDYPRNVMCTPLSGCQEEYFDVLPYAKEAAEYLLGFIKKVKLPRKLKVCFCNGNKNEVHATFRDLGFIAKENGHFEVYGAGGLGNGSKLGVKLVEDVEPEKILYVIKTMIDVFTTYGNYENRGKARTRFLQDTLTPEGLVKTFKETLQKNFETENIDIKIEADPVNKTGTGTIEHPRAIKQKQEGLYAVKYHPVGGFPPITFFKTIYNLVKDMEDVKLRIAPQEYVYIINLTAEEAQKVIDATPESATTEFETSLACVGAGICQVGLGNSQSMLQKCIDAVKEAGIKDKALPAISISGCPSSCSTYQVGKIGFRGAKKKTEAGMVDAFALFDNGCAARGEERFGVDMGTITVEDIPKFLVELGKKVEATGMDYDDYYKEYSEEFKELVKKYVG